MGNPRSKGGRPPGAAREGAYELLELLLHNSDDQGACTLTLEQLSHKLNRCKRTLIRYMHILKDEGHVTVKRWNYMVDGKFIGRWKVFPRGAKAMYDWAHWAEVHKQPIVPKKTFSAPKDKLPPGRPKGGFKQKKLELMLILKMECGRKGYTKISSNELTQRMKRSKSSVSKYLQCLRNEGVVSAVYNRYNNRDWSGVYTERIIYWHR